MNKVYRLSVICWTAFMMKDMNFQSFLLYLLISSISSEIEFIAVRLPLQVREIFVEDKSHFQIKRIDPMNYRRFRENVHCQMPYGHIHSILRCRMICSTFVFTIFRSILIFKPAISLPKQFNDTNHFSFHRNFWWISHHLVRVIFYNI